MFRSKHSTNICRCDYLNVRSTPNEQYNNKIRKTFGASENSRSGTSRFIRNLHELSSAMEISE